jgi:hypothetical protein
LENQQTKNSDLKIGEKERVMLQEREMQIGGKESGAGEKEGHDGGGDDGGGRW